MAGDFGLYTNKQKLCEVLLHCIRWGAAAPWISNDHHVERMRKRLRLQYSFDHLRMRSCIDLIEDTEMALTSFCKYGIAGAPNSKEDFGGRYLRLYGVLNAVQQQRLAIVQLFEILKISGKKEVSKKLQNLKIIEVRNIVGAHTVNFADASNTPEGIKANLFRITQNQLTDKCQDLHAVDSFGNVRYYNMYQEIISYLESTEKIMFGLTMNYLNKIFRNNIQEKKECLRHYEIEGLVPYNYTDLWELDKLRKIASDKILKELKGDFKNGAFKK